MKKAGIVIVLIMMIFFILQLWRPVVDKRPITGKITAPAEVSAILERACADCHSNENRLAWYERLAPASWFIAKDISVARSRYNLSTWDSLTPADQRAELWEMLNMAAIGRMPLDSYKVLHPLAKLSPQDIDILKCYVKSLSPANLMDTALMAAADLELSDYRLHPALLPLSPVAADGVAYVKDFQQWQVISTTNRFDNHTIRIVYGNELAAQTIKQGNVSIWPEGTTIVKLVWNSIEDSSGDIRPGTLNSVQIMTRDSKRFRETKGWGFAKFNGVKLVPYGETVAFNTTCFNCHKIAAANGYVFNVPPVDFSSGTKPLFDAKGQAVITSAANSKLQTMTILYGNTIARNMALARKKEFAPGAGFTLVTWKQVGDTFWYGSNINSAIQSIETIRIDTSRTHDTLLHYRLMKGNLPECDTGTIDGKNKRIDRILSQRASVIP